jgi:hypothetical protein
MCSAGVFLISHLDNIVYTKYTLNAVYNQNLNTRPECGMEPKFQLIENVGTKSEILVHTLECITAKFVHSVNTHGHLLANVSV